jgi:beta-catenin-like protein 1
MVPQAHSGFAYSSFLVLMFKVTEFDTNTEYVSEILAIILSQSTENKTKFAEFNGIDILLQVLAVCA